MNEQIRGLILKYIEAENNKDHALAEKILHDINEIKRLSGVNCSDSLVRARVSRLDRDLE